MQTEATGKLLSREETCFVRFLAIFLITNSHLDHLYPVSQLGTGGAIGNALFFMLSGYGLVVSEQGMRRSFPSWYWRRITRIYPSMLLVTFIDLAAGGVWRNLRFSDYVSIFIWPTSYWFITAIMVFYPLLFICMRFLKPGAFIFAIALLAVPYIYCYLTFMDLSAYTIEGPGYFKWLFYLQIMLFGGYLACGDIRIPQGKISHLLYLSGALLGYLAVIMAVRAGFGKLQALIHIMTFFIVYLILSLSRSSFVSLNIFGRKRVKYFIFLVAGLTLEIYLLQYLVYSNRFITALPFPSNIIVFWVIVVLLALVVSSAAVFIRRLLRRENIVSALTS